MKKYWLLRDGDNITEPGSHDSEKPLINTRLSGSSSQIHTRDKKEPPLPEPKGRCGEFLESKLAHPDRAGKIGN